MIFFTDVALRLERRAYGVRTATSVRSTNCDTLCGAVVVAVVINAVLSRAADPFDVLGYVIEINTSHIF